MEITVKGNTFEIINYSGSHAICRVITKKGYQYEGVWAIVKDEHDNMISPTLDEVQEEWKENKKSFDRKRGCL